MSTMLKDSREENVDILDEFLDKRLYDETVPKSQQPPEVTMNDLNRGEDDMFNTFLTDEINNDYMLFNGPSPAPHILGVDGFQLPEEALAVHQGQTLQSTMVQQLPPQQITEQHSPQILQQGQQQSQQIPQFTQASHSMCHEQHSQMQSAQSTPRSVAVLTPPNQQEIFTTPTGIYPGTTRSFSSSGYEPHVSSPYDSSYESARSLLSNLKFGRDSPAQFHNHFPKELLDIDSSTLPYQLRIENLPGYSRVETQIKLQVSVSPPPPQFLIHLPADTIAKQKLCLNSDLGAIAKENMLFLDTYVLTSSGRPCNICSRCVRREQKRASRRKSGVSDNLNWMTNANKRAIIFNCKEVISFPAMPTANNSRCVEISSRIVCYCRHHNEPKGFKLLVVLKNANGQVVAKSISTSVMIMDRKKHNEDLAAGVNTASNSANEASAMNGSMDGVQPISPASFEDDSSEPHTSDSRVFKRKRTWSPELSDGFSIAPSRKPSNTIKKEPISPQSQASTMDLIQQPITRQLSLQSQTPSPVIQRVIPAQGPLRGGIEVTLLGSNFKQGLVVKFGVNKALSTQCWSDTTMVTYLPPSSQPGQVVVTIGDPQNESTSKTGGAIFTYLDDTDRQMIELALQIVGLKMNGKLEDARNIARKIIGSDGAGSASSGQESQVSGLLPDNVNSYSTQPVNDEDLILKVINRLPSRPNWAICTPEGQTLLHLSALKGYSRLVSSLVHKGARVDYRDVRGYTPLHYAALAGDRKSIELLLSYKAKVDAKNDEGLAPEDVADSNVLDMFKYDSAYMTRKLSSSSITSSILSMDDSTELDIQGGQHVSRMTVDHLTDDRESEAYYSDSSAEASNEESEFDWEDDRDESLENICPRTETELVTPPVGTSIADRSLWNKMRNVFTNTSDQEQLPQYDDLYPVRAGAFSLPKLRFPTTLTSGDGNSSSSTTQADAATNSSDEGDDVFMKFFNQRKNVQNDKMLLFFWLPLLIMILSVFILMNAGYSVASVEKFQGLVRQGLGTIMLGNERVKVALNKHFNQMNDVVTSVIHAG